MLFSSINFTKYTYIYMCVANSLFPQIIKKAKNPLVFVVVESPTENPPRPQLAFLRAHAAKIWPLFLTDA